MLSTAANLPDPLVLALPVIADPVDQSPQASPQLIPDGVSILVVEVDGVHQLAVDVELQLVVGAVPDPDRARTTVTLQVIQGLLRQVSASVDAVHQLKRAVRLRVVGAVLEPTHERLGLLGEP